MKKRMRQRPASCCIVTGAVMAIGRESGSIVTGAVIAIVAVDVPVRARLSPKMYPAISSNPAGEACSRGPCTRVSATIIGAY